MCGYLKIRHLWIFLKFSGEINDLFLYLVSLHQMSLNYKSTSTYENLSPKQTKNFVHDHSLIMNTKGLFVFQKTRNKVWKTITYFKEKASLLLNVRHCIVKAVTRKHPFPPALVLVRGSSKWPTWLVAVHRFQGDTCFTGLSQWDGSEVMFKRRVLLHEAKEAEVAPHALCVGLCTPFPSKLAQRSQKSGSLAGFNGRMM